MKHQFIFVISLILVLGVACKNPKVVNNPESAETVAEKADDIQVVVQKILDFPKLQWIFHSDMPERLPVKLLANAFINEGLQLQKFNKNVRIASLSDFEKENIQDYLVFDDLNIKRDTTYFSLKYAVEGIQVKGKMTKTVGEWAVSEYDISEHDVVEKIPATALPSQKIAVLTLLYKGGDLGYLANKYYDNRAYRNVLSAYNDFEDKPSVDRKNDSINIPELTMLYKDTALPKLITISDELEKVIKARDIYLKQERALWNLPNDTDNRNLRTVPQGQKLELLGAAKLMYECVAGLEQQKNPPKKAIGQFRQVAENLENIANGNIDENGYALDMVHQRMAHGLANSIKWAKVDN